MRYEGQVYRPPSEADAYILQGALSRCAMARNILDKSPEARTKLRDAGLTRLYIDPESGDDTTLKRAEWSRGL